MKSIRHIKYILPILCGCLVLTAASIAFAQTARVLIDEFQVAKYVTDVQSAMNVPSVAVGIVGADRNYFFETYGPAGHEEPFAIGSLSKSVTAMAVMILVQDKKLTLDESASKWVDGVPGEVTVKDLLQQRSGLGKADDLMGWRKTDVTIEELVRQASWAEPRGEFSYSTLNYQILGAIVEKVSEQPFGAFVKERIFEPAGMTTAHAGPEAPSVHISGHKYVFGYPFSEGETRYAAAAVASDFVWMSARDMEKWIRLFAAGGKLEKKQVIPKDVMDALLAPEGTSPYGMGWFMADEGGLQVARSTGATRSFSASMAIVPERKIGVFVLTNVNSWNGYAPESI
ncbi:MAG: serine hydrolase domain-containing protein, partial [Bradymonadaceae bacterium]